MVESMRQTSAINYPGEVTISKLYITSMDGKYDADIKTQYLEFNIIEEIFKPYIYGNITIKDTIGLMTNFPILGEETLTVEFSTQLRPNIKKAYKFQVYAIRDHMADDTGTTAIYTLEFISPEQLLKGTKLVSANFNGIVSELITDLLQSTTYIGTTKSINIQQTAGVVNYTVPKKTPFEIIDFLRNRAFITNQNDSNYFLFFENSEGYTFTTLSNLITASLAKKKLIDAANTYSTDINFGDLRHEPVPKAIEKQTRNLQNGAFARYKNTLDDMKSGAYLAGVQYFDINQRSYNEFYQKYRDTFANTPHIDATSNTSYKQSKTFLDVYEQLQANFKMTTLDSSMTDFNFIPKLITTRLQHYLMFDQTPLVGTIYGDPSMVAGDIYNVNLPEYSSNQDKTYDDYLSGNYLVGRIIQTIQLAKYNMQLHLYKDSYMKPITPNEAYKAKQQ